MSREIYADGTVVTRWDDASRTVTTYDETGAVMSTRPYTADEDAGADQAVAGAANAVRLFVRDNGSSKTQLCVRFATGAVQVIATEP